MRRRAVLAALALLAGLAPFLGTPQADPPTHLTGYISVSVGTFDQAQLPACGDISVLRNQPCRTES